MKPSLERESKVYVHHETLRKEILRQSGMRKHSRFFFVCKTHLLFLLFDVLIGVAVVVAKAPHILVGGSYGAVVAS